MSKKFVVEFLDDAAFQSVEDLPDPEYDIAWELLDNLRDNPRFGKPLENHPTLGDLSDARTLYVIDFEKQQVVWPPPFRIVYRLMPNEKAPEKVQVIWAGERRNAIVYETAARRLGRL